jgi:hypothetical protein
VTDQTKAPPDTPSDEAVGTGPQPDSEAERVHITGTGGIVLAPPGTGDRSDGLPDIVWDDTGAVKEHTHS